MLYVSSVLAVFAYFCFYFPALVESFAIKMSSGAHVVISQYDYTDYSNATFLGVVLLMALARWTVCRRECHWLLPRGYLNARPRRGVAGSVILVLAHLGTTLFLFLLALKKLFPGNPDPTLEYPLGLVLLLYMIGLVCYEVSAWNWHFQHKVA
jgi:hypothetical protein